MVIERWPTVAGVMLLLCVGSPALADPPSAAGTWQQIDDKTGGVGALVAIREEGGAWNGYIIKIFPDPGDPPNPICDNCKGAQRGRPVLGMRLIEGLHRNGAVYDGGTITDPSSGTAYNVSLTVSPDGNRLDVHGYVGVALLGRTQVWTRLGPARRGARTRAPRT